MKAAADVRSQNKVEYIGTVNYRVGQRKRAINYRVGEVSHQL